MGQCSKFLQHNLRVNTIQFLGRHRLTNIRVVFENVTPILVNHDIPYVIKKAYRYLLMPCPVACAFCGFVDLNKGWS
jgi:hypothetical protein